MPEWEKLEGQDIGCDIAKVNCDEDKAMAKKHGVTGFPTIKFLPKGLDTVVGAVTYEGERTAAALRDFVRKLLG